MKALQASLKSDQTESKENEEDKNVKGKQLQIKDKIEATGEFEYQLTAVISHTNSISSVETGHYIADVFK